MVMKGLQEQIKQAQERYYRKINQIEKVVEMTPDRMVEPGMYEVYETDMDGRYTYVQHKFQLDNPMNLKEIALKLIVEKEYFSPWSYIQIRPATPDPIYKLG